MKRRKVAESFVNVPFKGIIWFAISARVGNLGSVFLGSFLVSDSNLKLYVATKTAILPLQKLYINWLKSPDKRVIFFIVRNDLGIEIA